MSVQQINMGYPLPNRPFEVKCNLSENAHILKCPQIGFFSSCMDKLT